MRWTLFRVTCTCAWRKALPVLRANPLLAAFAAVAAAATPGAAVFAGSRLSTAFAEAAARPGLLRVVAVGVGVSAAVAGVSVALLSPGPDALGAQVAAAPRSRGALAMGAVIVPVCATGLAFAVVLVCFAVPVAGSTGAVLVLAAVACAALGAAAGEGARLVAAAEVVKGGAVLGVAAAAWLSGGLAGGGAFAVGPPGAVGARSAPASLSVVTAVALALWVGACGVRRREHAPTRDVRLRRLPPRAGGAVAVSAARRVLRHPELRLHGATAVVLPVAAAVAARIALGVDGAAATAFCVAVTLTAVALYPPAALGLTRGGRWLLATAPCPRSTVAAAAAAGGVAAAAALVVLAALLAAPAGVADASTYLELEGASAFVLGCAALAGAGVPWHPDRVLHQLASYAAVLAVVVGAWVVVGRLDHVAPDGTVFALLAGNAMLVLGVGAAAAFAR